MNHTQRRHRILRNLAIGFGIVIALSWLTEIFRLPHYLFGEDFAPDWNRAILRTIILALIWGWIHLETRRLLKRVHHLEEFLLICPWCRRVGEDGKWVSIETYFGSKFDTRTSHGMCPECAAKMLDSAAKKKSGSGEVASTETSGTA